MEIKVGMILSMVGSVIALIGFFLPWLSGFVFGFKYEMTGYDLMKYLGTRYAFDATLIAFELVLSLIGLGMSFLYKRYAAATNIFVSVGGIAIPFHYMSSFISEGEAAYVGEGLIVELIGFFILLIASIYNNQKISEEIALKSQSVKNVQNIVQPTQPVYTEKPPNVVEEPVEQKSESTIQNEQQGNQINRSD